MRDTSARVEIADDFENVDPRLTLHEHRTVWESGENLPIVSASEQSCIVPPTTSNLSSIEENQAWYSGVAAPTTSAATPLLTPVESESLAARSARWRREARALVERVGRHVSPNVIAVLPITVAAVVIGATLPGAWIVVVAVIVGICLALQSTLDMRAALTMLFCATVAVTGVDYLTWRFEVSNWAGWWIAAPLLAAEIFGALHTLGLQYTLWPRPQPAIARVSDPTTLPIYIFIPTVDEGVNILRPTLRAVKEASRRYTRAYPGARVKIIVCNDGFVANAPDWRETETLARQLHVRCVTRQYPGGAKAGNLEHARQVVGATGDALVVIFDADQQPEPDFLLKTIPPFSDLKVGWVQTGQYYRNIEQPVAKWANDQQSLFYRVLCPGKSAQNAAFICGTNVVLRAAALDEIGGLPQDSVTEDFAASIDLHGRWRSVFISGVLAKGLGPMDLPAYLKQQRRWAIGTLGVLRSRWRTIALPWVGDLSFGQRIQYALACTHYISGLRDLVYILAPLAFLSTGIPAVRGASLALFIWHFLPYWGASQLAFVYATRRQSGLRGIVIGFGSFLVLLSSIMTVILGKRSAFMVTSKRRGAARSWQSLVPYVGFLLLCVTGLVWGFSVTSERRDAVLISMLWIAYSAALLSGFLWLSISDLRYQEKRLPSSQATGARLWSWLAIANWQNFLRRYTAPQASYQLLSVSLLVGVIVVSMHSFTPSNDPFTPKIMGPGHVYLGASVREDMIGSVPSSLNTMLCEPFTIIGRTQDIQDTFSDGWAAQLGSQNARPWIVLEFGEMGPDGKPPLSASLPAIVNGVQDGNIRRWADEIKAYGQPVYLTILLHVDRNWAVSSAVANGGIPQDTARAWLHVRSVFRAEGVDNVAWVWSPADPAHDQRYAPPEASIDIVLQSFVRYPGTSWPNVSQVLAEVSARHPNKPLFVEASATGDPQAKSAWLNQVATSVAHDPLVYALLYHNGAPDLHASAVENKQWSLDSDPLTMQSVRAWRTLTQASQPAC